MDQDLKFRMPRRVPLAKRFADPRRNAGDDEAGLGRDEMAARAGPCATFGSPLARSATLMLLKTEKLAMSAAGSAPAAAAFAIERAARQEVEKKRMSFGREATPLLHCFLFHFGLSIG